LIKNNFSRSIEKDDILGSIKKNNPIPENKKSKEYLEYLDIVSRIDSRKKRLLELSEKEYILKRSLKYT
jgi:hypothetical protein